jgi:hypothetical protein
MEGTMKGRRDKREARGSTIPLFLGGITVEWRLKTKIKLLSLLIIFFSALLYYLVKPRDTVLGQPLPQRLPGVGQLRTSKPCRYTGNQLHHGVVVCWMVVV